MRPLAAILAVLFFLASGPGASAADPEADFTGSWIFNTEKSDPVARVTPIGRAAGPGAMTAAGPGSRPPIGRQAPPGNPPPKQSPAGNPQRVPEALQSPGVFRGIGGGTFDGTIPVATDVPLVLTRTGTELQVVNALRIKGMSVPNKESYTLDGKKHEDTVKGNAGSGVKREIKASLKKNRIKIEIVNTYPDGGKFRTTREFSLSGDGKTLTVEASSQTPHLLSSQKMVYDRQ